MSLLGKTSCTISSVQMGNVILSVPRIVRSTIFSTNRPFPSSPGLCIKTRLSAQPLKGTSFTMTINVRAVNVMVLLRTVFAVGF